MCGFCVVFHKVNSPMAGDQEAMAERVSMGLGMSFCWLMVSLTVMAASAKAASVSPPAATQWNAWLLGASSWSCGAPSPMAASGLMTAGSGS